MGDPTIGIDLGDGSVAITIFFTVAVLLVWLVPTFRPRRWALAGIAHSWRTDGWWGVPVANEPSYDVVDRELRIRAIRDVLDDAFRLGLGTRGVLPSPIEGAHGNREALVHLTPSGVCTADAWAEAIAAAAG